MEVKIEGDRESFLSSGHMTDDRRLVLRLCPNTTIPKKKRESENSEF